MDSLEFTKGSVFTKSTKSGKRLRRKDNSFMEDERLVEPEMQEGEDDDEFEKEMLTVFEERLHKAEVDGGIKSSSTTPKPSLIYNSSEKSNKNMTSNCENKLYDKIYFDSDDDSDEEGNFEGSTASSKDAIGKEKKILSNEELMYDPELDDEDQAWADNIRNRFVFKNLVSKILSSDN